MIKFIETKYADILTEIRTKNAIDATLDDKIKKALDEFKTQFTY
jgi:F0F1-type ATP synthase alpha subunit